MDTLEKKLTDRMVKISARAEKITLNAVNENRGLTDPEKEEVGRLLADFNDFGAQLRPDDFKPVNTVAEAEAWLDAPAGRDTVRAGVLPGAPRNSLMNVAPTELAYGKKPTFTNMFGDRVARETHGFKSMNEFLRVAGSQRYDQRLRVMDASMSEGVGADGGFLVPDAYVRMMLDASLESEIVRPRANIVPMVSKTAIASGFDTMNHTGGSIAGFSLQWLGELGTGTRQKGKVRRVMLTAHKAAIFTQASNELADDAPGFGNDLESTLIQAVGWGIDYYAIHGTGAGQPLGLMNDPALITVSKEGSQAASTLLAANILKMYARMHPACIGNAIWMASSTTIPQLASVFIESTTGGYSEPILKQQGDAFFMMGRPVILTEKCPTLGSKGDLVLVDWSQYALGMRKEITIERSNAPGWTEDATDWRTIIRLDGQGKWNAPVTPKNGDTLSWCVVLEAR